MTTKKKATAQGARRVVAYIDKLASVIQAHHEALGLPEKVAMDFAYRCDLLSDAIPASYGPKFAAFFDPSQIAEEVPGPLVNDPTQPFMAGHFTQEKFDQLSAKQEGGELSANAEKHVADPKLASLIQAAATKAAKEAASLVLASLKKAEEEKAEDTKTEEKAEETKPEEKKAGEESEEDSEEEEAQKAASFFGLFSDK
jgi:hypothetical protein